MNNDKDGNWARMHLDEDHPLAEIGNAIIEMAHANVRELKNMTEKKQMNFIKTLYDRSDVMVAVYPDGDDSYAIYPIKGELHPTRTRKSTNAVKCPDKAVAMALKRHLENMVKH